MLSMRTKTTHAFDMSSLILMSTSFSVVLTMDQSFRAPLVVPKTLDEFVPGQFWPSGVQPVVLNKDYDGGPSFSPLHDAEPFWPFSDGYVWPTDDVLVSAVDNTIVYEGWDGMHFAMPNDYAVSLFTGLQEGRGIYVSGPFCMPNVLDCWWVAMEWQFAMQSYAQPQRSYRSELWGWVFGSLLWLFVVCLFVHALFYWAVPVIRWALMATPRVILHGFESALGSWGCGVESGALFWLVIFGNISLCSGVCQVCHGFYVGCNGGGDSRTCKEAAQVAANVAAVATATGAIKLVGLFNTRILRVFTATVLGLVARYKSMPVAGTPYDFGGKSNSEVVADVTAGKVSKSEALVHFSKKIEEAANLGEDEGRVAKTSAIEAQIRLLGAMDDKAASSSSSTPLIGVHRFPNVRDC